MSDHENGIDAGPLAYMLGARVFEKHFTLDRSLKGNRPKYDQSLLFNSREEAIQFHKKKLESSI